MTIPFLPLPAPPDRPVDRPAPQALAVALAALDPLPLAPAGTRSAEYLRPVLFQWLAVLESAGIGELAGLTDDLRELIGLLSPTKSGEPVLPHAPTHDAGSALHRVGLSIERLAAWGRPAGLSDRLLTLGQHLLTLSEGLSNQPAPPSRTPSAQRPA